MVEGQERRTRYAPLGPFLATPDELRRRPALPMWLTVNGESRQKSSTKDMVFRVPFLVSYLSRFMTLLAGRRHQHRHARRRRPRHEARRRYLKAGDVVELGIDGLGTQRQRIVASV